MMASSAAGAFAKSAGGAAFDALKKRLTENDHMDSIDLLDKAADKPGYQMAIKDDLDRADLAADSELKQLAETILSAIEAIPQDARPTVAIDADAIRAKGNQLFRNVQGGIRAGTIEAGGDQIFEDITAGKR